MNIKELEHSAMRAEALPEGLDPAEQLLYLCLRLLYMEYRKQIITQEQAKKEKQQIMKEFTVNQVNCNLYQSICRLRVDMAQINKEIELHGCELCKKMVKIMDGRLS